MASAVVNIGKDSIPEHLLCPICFELPDSEVYQCVDGHVLCKACFVKLKECPHCRRSFGVTPPIRNRHFEALLEELKAKNCPFNSNGCKEKPARNVLDSHKATCPYNFEKFGKFVNICKLIGFTSCEFLVNKGNTKDAVDHLVSKHGCALTEKTAFQIELTSFVEGSSVTNSNWTPVIAKQKDSFVVIVPLVYSKKALGWLTVLLEQAKASKNVEVKYTLRTDSRRWTYAEIPLRLSKIGQSPPDYDLIFSQSPFQLSGLSLNFAESLIVDVKIRKNEEIKDERNPGNNRIVCTNIVSVLSNERKKKAFLPKNSKTDIQKPPPPSPPVTVDKEELFALAKNGDLQKFKSVVKEAPQYKNIKNDEGQSLLHLTMLDPDEKVGLGKAKFLVEEMNADIFILTNIGESLLHYATNCSDDKAVKYFLEEGLDVYAVDTYWRTPLHCACLNWKSGVANAKMLLRYGADCTMQDRSGMNPIESADCERNHRIANLLRKASQENN